MYVSIQLKLINILYHQHQELEMGFDYRHVLCSEAIKMTQTLVAVLS